MNINFELYRIFYEVAKEGNITKASENLLISQPAVSKSIKSLENQLGGTLFIRTKKGVILTEEGKEFYNYIKYAIEYINNAENRFSDLINLEVGTIKIGISVTLTKNFLLPYLKIFHERYPKIKIQIYTLLTSELFFKLKEGLIDIVILNLPYNSSSEIKIIECKKVQDVFIVNENYKNLVNKKLKLEDLNNYPLILQQKKSNTRAFLDNFCKANNIVLNPNMSLSSYSLVTEFTKIGFGIGYATKEYIKKELDNNELYELDVVPKIPPRGIGIAYSNINLPSFSTKKFIKIILEEK